MAKERTFSLSAVRTDGWFERIGEGIGSFQALCDIAVSYTHLTLPTNREV